MKDFFKNHWQHIISYGLVVIFIAVVLWMNLSLFK